jgi:arginine exporter protein ArgO
MAGSLDAFLSGVFAGYGIAIPVGPIAILIVELGLRRGFRVALSAGAGAASADLIYATVAALAGTILVSLLAPFATIIRVGSAIVLIALGAWLLYHGRNLSDRTRKPRLKTTNCPQTYGMTLGLTLLNPVTITYFTTLILGMQGFSPSSVDAILFITGAFMASFSWQSFLASINGIARKQSFRETATSNIHGWKSRDNWIWNCNITGAPHKSVEQSLVCMTVAVRFAKVSKPHKGNVAYSKKVRKNAIGFPA